MNYISIINSRWHDHTILMASWKIGNTNQIKIDHHDYPEPFYMTREEIMRYPTTEIASKNGNMVKMYVVPINDLKQDLLLEEL